MLYLESAILNYQSQLSFHAKSMQRFILRHRLPLRRANQEIQDIFEMNETHNFHVHLYVTLLNITPKSLTQRMNRLGCKHSEDW